MEENIMSSLTAPDLRESEKDFFERLNYFFGKLLTVRDFVSEQRYFNEKRWMLNRQTIGWGVICGLEVLEVENCPTQVTVKPGLALDCYGHEIFLGKEETIDLVPKEKEKADSLKRRPIRPTPAPTPQPDSKIYYICIKYKECLTEPVPAPVQKCGLPENECLFSRVRELYELKAFDDLPAACDSEAEIGCPGIIADPCNGFTKPCKERTICDCIVLAKVILENGKISEIDNLSYRKWLWSNEELAHCLKETVFNVRAARVDRRQFVPLLTYTIKGLKHHDGRILTITDYWADNETLGKIKSEVGIEPHDITTDGEYIWFTDRAESDTSVLKMDRSGLLVEKLSVKETSWGIAFDGCYMWVTHPEKHSVSKIKKDATSSDTLDAPIDLTNGGGQPYPKDIIYAGNYVWIACENGVIRIDVKNNTIEPFTDFGFTPIALAFDGTHIWLVHNGLRKQGEVKKIDLEGGEVPIDPEIYVKSAAKCLVFDGTHMWVTHSDGATQIDINENEVEREAATDNTLTGAAFDGMYLWAAEPEGKKIHRIDIYNAQSVSEFRPSEHLKDNRHYAKMCFDGTYIWVTDYVQDNQDRKGVIHRLLL
jgi:hypothetical protein